MKLHLLLLAFFTLLFGTLVTKGQVSKDNIVADSSVRVFDDFKYNLRLHVFNTEASDENQPNAILTLSYMGNFQDKIFLKDSLYCMKPWIQFKDFNQDGENDILIFNTSSARSNWTHYLYIVDKKKHKLIPVEGFSKLTNPDIIKESGLITSFSVFGNTIVHSYYKITKNYKLVKTSKDYEETIN